MITYDVLRGPSSKGDGTQGQKLFVDLRLHMFHVLRVRSGVNPTGQRSTNACHLHDIRNSDLHHLHTLSRNEKCAILLSDDPRHATSQATCASTACHARHVAATIRHPRTLPPASATPTCDPRAQSPASLAPTCNPRAQFPVTTPTLRAQDHSPTSATTDHRLPSELVNFENLQIGFVGDLRLPRLKHEVQTTASTIFLY